MQLKIIILGLLARRALSGYDIWRWLSVEGRFLRAKTDRSQIYRALNAMADEDVVSFTIEASQLGPDSKVYRLTPAGIHVLDEWLSSPYQPTARYQEPDFSLRFMLAAALRPRLVIDLIDIELSARREQVLKYRDRDRTIVVGDGGLPIPLEFAQLLADDQHWQGSRGLDDFIAWLTGERAKVSAYLDSHPEVAAIEATRDAAASRS